MPEEYYDTDFPNLRGSGFKLTSKPAAEYNCIAYVVGDYKRNWWPGEYHPIWSLDYWPLSDPGRATLDVFIEALATPGVDYEPCPDGSLEEGYEKVAIYVLNGSVTHAARQRKDGTWRSKLGLDEDIEHTLAGLEGGLYGNVAAFLKRPRRPEADPPDEEAPKPEPA